MRCWTAYECVGDAACVTNGGATQAEDEGDARCGRRVDTPSLVLREDASDQIAVIPHRVAWLSTWATNPAPCLFGSPDEPGGASLAVPAAHAAALLAPTTATDILRDAPAPSTHCVPCTGLQLSHLLEYRCQTRFAK